MYPALLVQWDQGLRREVLKSRAYIIIGNKKDNLCSLIDVAVTPDRNLIEWQAGKKVKIGT